MGPEQSIQDRPESLERMWPILEEEPVTRERKAPSGEDTSSVFKYLMGFSGEKGKSTVPRGSRRQKVRSISRVYREVKLISEKGRLVFCCSHQWKG